MPQADSQQLFVQSAEATLTAIQQQEAMGWTALTESAAAERPFEPLMNTKPDIGLKSAPKVLPDVTAASEVGDNGCVA